MLEAAHYSVVELMGLRFRVGGIANKEMKLLRRSAIVVNLERRK
jgi:hypothetical protein